MGFVSRVAGFIRRLVFRQRLDQDLQEEFSEYVEELTQRHIRSGLSPGDARDAALRDAGPLDVIRDRIRRERLNGILKTATVLSAGVVCFLAGVGVTAAAVRWGRPEWVEKVVLGTQRQKAREFLSRLEFQGSASPLFGVVLDNVTRQPLNHVRVTLLPTKDIYKPEVENLPQYCETDQWGRFFFTQPPARVYQLTIRDLVIPINGAFDAASYRATHLIFFQEKGMLLGWEGTRFTLFPPNRSDYSVSVTMRDGRPASAELVEAALGRPTHRIGKVAVYNYRDAQLEIRVPGR